MATSRPAPVLAQPVSYHPPPLPAHPVVSHGDQDRCSPSPTPEENNPMGMVGFELTVFGLDHQNPDLACDHLVQVLNDLRNRHSFLPVNIHRGDATSALDYAFISLSSAVTGPCPDLLEDLHLLLNLLPDLWASCDSEAQSLLDPLCEWFQTRHMSIMVECTTHPPSSSQTHISFDLFDGTDVDHIMRELPFIHGRTLCPGHPCFVVPLYGGEVVIGGIAGLGNVEPSLNSHLCQWYGHDIIVCSWVELDDDVYCVVFKDWSTMQAFLHENQNGLPTEWFLYGVSVGKPTLLFSFNTQGAPPNPVSHCMAFSTLESTIQPQLDFFCIKFGHFMSMLNTMFERISQAEQQLEQNNQALLGMMSTQFLLGDYCMNLLLLTNEQDQLTTQYNHYQEQLAGSPDPSSHQHLLVALKEVDDHCCSVAAEIEQVCIEMQAV
ncbi:hypothetical protein EDC04DRAFT_3003328 [Pisolithus marmoratus]|nr:hypothetical protein EDC04DRAFT_3003328 [Pisolithus marmoratus]